MFTLFFFLFPIILSIDWHCRNKDDKNILEEREDYFEVKLDNCTAENCPLPSICSEDERCICAEGYANYPPGGENGMYCVYKQSKRLTVFLLELLAPIGIGHYLILGKKYFAIFKACLALLPWLLGLLGAFKLIRTQYFEGKFGCFMSVFLFISSLAFFILWIADFIYIFLYKDLRNADCVPVQDIF
ncbi:MAG: hypothetical protein MJ252_01025 [archaeon]|nr:hypothetical protein [archaeon]